MDWDKSTDFFRSHGIQVFFPPDAIMESTSAIVILIAENTGETRAGQRICGKRKG